MVMIVLVIYVCCIFLMVDISKFMMPLFDGFRSVYDVCISPEVVFSLAQEVTENNRIEFFKGIDDSVSVIKNSIEDTDLAGDQRMEVLVLILTLAMRAQMEKYLADRLMKVYFEEPEKERKDRSKRQKVRPVEMEKELKEDNLSEI